MIKNVFDKPDEQSQSLLHACHGENRCAQANDNDTINSANNKVHILIYFVRLTSNHINICDN